MTASNELFVARLTRSRIFQIYAHAFRTALSVPLDFVPADETGAASTVDIPWSPNGGGMARRCSSPPPRSMVPVRLGPRIVGFLRVGQGPVPSAVAARPCAPAPPARSAGDARVWERRVPQRTPSSGAWAQHRAAVALLQIFAEHLELIGERIVAAENAFENPLITRIKKFIAENLFDELKLADGARAAHMSTCYFCKVFKRATGFSFTEYVSRQRIDEGRARLQNPHVRVSEVAFAVGFQSLSQFNRVFKRLTGVCPSEYRRGLSKPEPDPPVARDASLYFSASRAGHRRISASFL